MMIKPIIYASWKYRAIVVRLPWARIVLSFIFSGSQWEWAYWKKDEIYDGDRCRTFSMGFFTLETWEPINTEDKP
jgi:hypothetical protein